MDRLSLLLAVAGWLAWAYAAFQWRRALKEWERTQEQLESALAWIERTIPLVAESWRREG